MDRLRCLFVHVPKAAGTSVASCLFECKVGHITLRRYSLIFEAEAFREYFKFAVVRNPWDRLFSAFRYLKGPECLELDRAWANAHLSGIDTFERFVLDWLPRNNVDISYVHLVPQYRFLRLRGDAPAVDFLARFESLSQDFEHIRKRLGVEASLSHLNRSSRPGDYRDAYTNEMKEIVGRVYRKDVAALGYVFDGVRTPVNHS
jgi:hypothetical protein